MQTNGSWDNTLDSLLVEAAPDAILVVDHQGIIVRANARTEALFGYPPQTLLDTAIEDLLPDAWADTHRCHREQYFHAPRARPIGATGGILKAKHRDGRSFPVEISLSPIVQGDSVWVAAAVRDATERERTESQLREFNQTLEDTVAEQTRALSAQRAALQSFLDEAPDLIQSIDARGRFLYVNRIWCETLGYSAEEARQLGFQDIVHPDYLPHCNELFRLLGAGKPVPRVEVVFVTKQGESVPLEGAVRGHYEDGRLQATRGMFRDISERRRFEQALRDSETQLQTVIDALPALVAFVDTEQRFLLVNGAYKQWFGLSKTEVRGKHLVEVLGSAAYRGLLPYVEQVLGGEEVEFDLQRPDPDGTIRMVHCNYLPNWDREGRVSGFFAHIMDVSDRHRMAEALRQSEEQIRLVNDSVPILIADVDRQERYRYVNAAYESSFAMSREQIQQMTVRELLGESVYGLLQPHIATVLGGEKTVFELERPDPVSGNQVHLKVSYVPRFSGDDEVMGFYALGVDITQYRQQEQALREAKEQAEAGDRLKSEFLANMSHEIRTPLNAIIGFADLMKARLESDDSLYHYVRGIHTSGRNLLQLINDVLDISKLEAGRLKISPQPVDLRTLGEEIRSIFAAELERKSLAFHLEVATTSPVVLLDAARLRQVLLNLVGNAVKFTHRGQVRLAIETAGELPDRRVLLVFQVEDTGIGIPPSQQAHIFEAFRQRENQASNYGGTGLGLAITRQLVELMHGHISVDSTFGEGSRFQVVLRAERAQEAELPRVQAVHWAPRFHPATVLVVDDVDINREVIHALLEDQALQLIDAENGEQALAQCQQMVPDLILLDLRMPVMDGHDCARRLRQDPRLQQVPIAVMSASEKSLENASLEQDINAYLRKPITQQQLLELLARFLAFDEETPAATPPARIAPSPDPVPVPEMPPEVVLRRFLDEIVPAYQALAKRRSFSRINDFARAVQQLGAEHGVAILERYGSELLSSTSTMRVSEINRLLKCFPEIRQQLSGQKD